LRKLVLILCAIFALVPAAITQQAPRILIPEDQGWRIHAGDEPAFASPTFDDSSWKPTSFISMSPTCPSGVCWLRKRISLPAATDPLQLYIVGTSGSFQVFIDGQPVGSPITSDLAWKFGNELVYPLRAPDSASTEVEVALRCVQTRSSFSNFRSRAGVLMGDSRTIATVSKADQGSRIGFSIVPIMVNAVLLGAGLLLILLYRQQRGHAEYLWLGVSLICNNAIIFAMETGLAPTWANMVIGDPFSSYFYLAAQLQFVYSFAARRPGRVVRGYQILLLVLPFVVQPLGEYGLFGALPYLWFEDAVTLPGVLMILALLVVWYRRGNREAGLLIVPMFLANLSDLLIDFAAAVRYSHPRFQIPSLHLGLITITDWSFANILFLFTIGLIIFQRFTRIARDQALAHAELESARSIQQVLIPEALPDIPNLRIESVYHPAQQVGGDFFQIVPLGGTEQGTLVAIGDVSGKGLPAAMNVALIVGTLRTLAEQTSSPAQILAGLNRRLLGRGAGFTTCLVLHILPTGDVTIANAGHLNPYLAGAELELPNGLPLGITSGAEYAESRLTLTPDQTLTLITDGVVEATNHATRELFGFDRTLAISHLPAHEIASTAQTYGQEDDIAVLTLQFVPA